MSLLSLFFSTLKQSFLSFFVGCVCQTVGVPASVSWTLSSASPRPPQGPPLAEWNEKAPAHVLHAVCPSKDSYRLPLEGKNILTVLSFSTFLPIKKHFGFGCLSPKCWDLQIRIFYRALLSGFNRKARGIIHTKTTLCNQILVLLMASLLHLGVGLCTPGMEAEQLPPWKPWWRGSFPATGFCAAPGASPVWRSSGDSSCIRISPAQTNSLTQPGGSHLHCETNSLMNEARTHQLLLQ